MSEYGKLVPQGGGEEIPLLHEHLTLGRRESCDICLRFQNISGTHCEFNYIKGCWVVTDLGSKNGLKVNDERVQQKKVLQPGDVISIAKHSFVIEYDMVASKETLDELMDEAEGSMDQPLLEKAGLIRPEPKEQFGPPRPGRPNKPATFGSFELNSDEDEEEDDEA